MRDGERGGQTGKRRGGESGGRPAGRCDGERGRSAGCRAGQSNGRRSGIRIMAELIVLVRPLAHIMAAAILFGSAGHLCANFLAVTAVAGLLRALSLSPAGAMGIPFPETLTGIFVLLMLFAVFRGILHYLEQECNHDIAFRLLALIRHQVFAALRRLAPAKLEGRGRGELISVITSDIELLEVFYAHTISPAAIAFITSAVMTVFIGRIHPLCGLWVLIGYLIVGVAIPVWNSGRGAEAGAAYRKEFGELNGFLLDSLRGLRELLQYGGEERRLLGLRDASDQLAARNETLKKLDAGLGAVTGICISFFTFGMLFLGLFLYRRGEISAAGMAIVTAAAMSSFGPVTALSGVSANLLQTFACGDRVLSILKEEPQVNEVSGEPETEFAGAELSDVTFSYGEETILDYVSMEFPDGKIVGLHGKSGSGKSTALRLLMRFWDVKNGAAKISGRDVRSVNTQDLRRMEGLVTQETVLFHDSIANNIAIGRQGASREEIMGAAGRASIHDWIESLPQGYDTPVAELGDSLSGGERQRIGLARAFLHDAPFLLLDEPTSNLDSLNEGVILKSLKEESRARTVVLVSHRKSTMGIADAVIEMDAGRVS